MDKDVLLIGNTRSFMYNAVANGLKHDGFKTQTVPMIEDEIRRTGVQQPFWILYLDEENVGKEFRDQYSFIKENVLMNNPRFLIIGHTMSCRISISLSLRISSQKPIRVL